MAFPFSRIWGRVPRLRWADVLVLAGVAGFVLGFSAFAHTATKVMRPAAEIDLSLWSLPEYTLYSLARGLIAYGISLVFTLAYGYWAAKDRLAERVLIPLLDILQSIPVLGFMPGLVLALVSLFPRSNLGLELAAILMIFTGQAWNMTFSFYHSLRSIPRDQEEAAAAYRFSAWQRFRWVELPSSAMGLVWNSMMSMAGGWFFLMVSEAFQLGDKDFRLPGVGSYMAVAVHQGNVPAMVGAVVAMVVMIVAVDQVLWRPIAVWAQKFRVEETGASETAGSWFLDLVRHSRVPRAAVNAVRSLFMRVLAGRGWWGRATSRPPRGGASRGALAFSRLGFAALVLLLVYGGGLLLMLLARVPRHGWFPIAGGAGLTLLRVLAVVAVGTLWTVPVGLWIGLSPRLSAVLQPVVQIVASFPAPMLFPVLVALFQWGGVSMNWGSMALMILGAQWYILFNVIGGAMAIPGDLLEAARSYRFSRWETFRRVHLPGIFPYLVTGWVTAAGGAWNASIVSEYVTFRGEVLTANGVGAQISLAAERGDFPHLAASVLVMSAVVVLFNRTVWRRLYQVAEQRYSLTK